MWCRVVWIVLWSARCAKDSVASSGISRSMFIQHATNKMKTIKDKYVQLKGKWNAVCYVLYASYHDGWAQRYNKRVPGMSRLLLMANLYLNKKKHRRRTDNELTRNVRLHTYTYTPKSNAQLAIFVWKNNWTKTLATKSVSVLRLRIFAHRVCHSIVFECCSNIARC